MAQGVQVFDASGNLTFTTDDSLARVCGSTRITGGVNGSINVDLSGGRPYAFFQQMDDAWSAPAISVSTTTISWTWPVGMTKGGILFYGYY